jgi:hypothetical protein
MESGSHRRMTDWERRLILRLLEPDFPGRDSLRDQIEQTLVLAIDENGSLDLEYGGATLAAVEKRVPTEGEASDRDGMTIHYLLHVVAGKVKELEVYRDDSSVVLQRPEPEDVQVMVLGS